MKTFIALTIIFAYSISFAGVVRSSPVQIIVQPSAPPETGMPTWRQGMAIGEWKAIPNTAMSNAPVAVKTFPQLSVLGPEGKITAWNGLGVDTRDSSIYSPANGGHQDYAGNEVDRIRLSDNNPAWTEVRASTPVNQIVADRAHYSDGRPASRHSYYGVFVNEVRNRVMVLGGALWGLGFSPGGVLDGFNLATNDWDTTGTYPTGPSQDFGPYNGWAEVEQKSTGDIYVFAGFSVLRWNNSSNIWERKLQNTSIYGQYAATALDTKRNRILVAGGNVNDHGIYDLNANTAQNITFTGPNAGITSGDGNGMVYDPEMDVFLLRKGTAAGATVYRIHPTTFSIDVMPTTGGTSIPSTEGIGAGGNNCWRRFLYVPKLKGIVYVPTYGSNIWFLRTK